MILSGGKRAAWSADATKAYRSRSRTTCCVRRARRSPRRCCASW